MQRYFLEISYNGTNFHGWQNQPNANTVQEELEKALRTILRQQVDTVGCGRTDAGVHATNFYAHFDAAGPVNDPRKFTHGLNALLPDEIAIRDLLKVGEDAHARFDATERSYRYDLNFRKDPFLTNRSYLYHERLELKKMNEACKFLLGKQEFDSFCKAGADNKTMLCDVREAHWEQVDADRIRFHITADRFLRNMVRAIVGTLIDIGRGDLPAEHMRHVIAAKDRGAAGTSIPACGLYLDKVLYPYNP